MKNKIAAAVLASATVIRIGNAMATSHQLCAETSFFEKGNWYCKPVQLITYENVGRAGSYKEVVDMDQETGECRFAERAYGGPLAPFNEPVRMCFLPVVQIDTNDILFFSDRRADVDPFQGTSYSEAVRRLSA